MTIRHILKHNALAEIGVGTSIGEAIDRAWNESWDEVLHRVAAALKECQDEPNSITCGTD